jgi:murein DD-endopeptidase MepM/ murein hydrolase activator NlpD
MKERIQQYFANLREKHKLSFINDSNYQEKWSFRVSTLNLISLFALFAILIVIILFLLLKYTPLQSIIIDSDAFENRELLKENTRAIDSLYQKTISTQKYLDNLKRILNDEPLDDSLLDNNKDSSLQNYQPSFLKAEEDSILRAKVESSNKTLANTNHSDTYEFFFTPVNGTISRSFDLAKNHLGVDVVTRNGEPIKTCLEGTVVFTGWVENEGKIIIVQHKDDLVSIYKHCSSVLKKTGDRVLTGDPIGIVGNSGEHSSGPHLHFEIWKKGKVVNPETYISF